MSDFSQHREPEELEEQKTPAESPEEDHQPSISPAQQPNMTFRPTGSAPEPPDTWRPDANLKPIVTPAQRDNTSTSTIRVGKDAFTLKTIDDLIELESARRYLIAAEIMAPVSLLIGGTLLSTVAVIFAIIGYLKMKAIGERNDQNPVIGPALRRTGIIAICISGFICLLNIVNLVVMFNILSGAIATGNFDAFQGLWPFGSSPVTPSGGNQTWG